MNHLVDVAINLTADQFFSDLDSIISDGYEAGVRQMVVPGWNLDQCRHALHLSKKYRGMVYTIAGVHPYQADKWDDEMARAFREMAEHREVVAIGECGFDFFRDLATKENQERAYIDQLEMAVDLELPAYFHERDGHHEFVRILRQYRDQLTGGCVHCFNGTEKELKAYLDLDLYIGMTGMICHKKRGKHLREMVKLIPDDRLMVETDGPYLLPHTLRKQSNMINVPANLPHIVEHIAQCRNQSPRHIAETTTANGGRFFGWSRQSIRSKNRPRPMDPTDPESWVNPLIPDKRNQQEKLERITKRLQEFGLAYLERYPQSSVLLESLEPTSCNLKLYHRGTNFMDVHWLAHSESRGDYMLFDTTYIEMEEMAGWEHFDSLYFDDSDYSFSEVKDAWKIIDILFGWKK